jgi:hypothetical protein
MTYAVDPRVDAYIDALPAWQQAICHEVREIVHAADPEVVETIKRTEHCCLENWTLPADLPGTLRSEQMLKWLAIYCQLSGCGHICAAPPARLCNVATLPALRLGATDGRY